MKTSRSTPSPCSSACSGRRIAQLDAGASGPLHLRTSALVGLGVGVIIAIGGGWKDAPTEGFDLLKFFRSPWMTVAYTLLLSQFTGSYLEAAVASIGFERATAETSKTFFVTAKPRGKFAGKPVHYPDMFTRRRSLVPAYVAICAAVVFSAGFAFGGQRDVRPASVAAVNAGSVR